MGLDRTINPDRGGGNARRNTTRIIPLIRHFEDLRDGTHGGAATRQDKETHFQKAVDSWLPSPGRFSPK